MKYEPVLSEAISLEILLGLTTAVIWLDKNEDVRFINLAASELLQLSVVKVIGVNWRDILPKLLDEIKACGTGRLTLHDYEVNLPNNKKTYLTCNILFYEVSGTDGWLIEMYDTKRLHRISDEGERWHQYEAGRLLVKTLAHEIKNSLAGIYGSAQLLRKRIPRNEKSEKFIGVITNEVNRLKNLVDRMLGPSKYGLKEKRDIHGVLSYVLEVIDVEKTDNILIKLDYDPSIPEIFMDFESMVQAFLNIVKNAIQAMQKYGGLLTIKTRVETRFTLSSKTYPVVAVISIIDQGEGICPNIFDKMFYPMVTSKKEGTGLGLPVAQNVIRNHQGLIVAESKPGNTIFNIYLPIEVVKNES